MTWNYSGDPAASDLDQVRFLIGDTLSVQPLIQNEEINFAIAQQSTLRLAAAVVLRALAARYTRYPNFAVGDVSASALSDVAEGFMRRARELDPTGVTAGSALCAPSFGGLTLSEKEMLDGDTDAVQPLFRKGADDYPGTSDSNASEN